MKLFIQSSLLFKKFIIQTHQLLNYLNNSQKLKKKLGKLRCIDENKYNFFTNLTETKRKTSTFWN